MSPWELMALPFLECLVLVGIHSYLGIHVIKRKVIFVDLALAQIAAMGTIVAFLFGLQPHTQGAYVFSLLFTFLGAAVFSLTRLRQEKIPQEAVIGLVYALAASVSILIIDRAPHGAEHIKEILTGSILWVKWESVLIAAVVYAVVGAFHYIFRDRFFLISADPQEAYRQGISVRLWDFLFYMSFGVVITLSVHTAGVLLVFVFLVVPAIMAILITDRLVYQLLIGWGVGTIVSFFGLAASYAYDFPSGPMVVSVYGAALLIAALIIYVVRSKKRQSAIIHILIGAGATALVIVGFYAMGHWFAGGQKGEDNHHHNHGANHTTHHKHTKTAHQHKNIDDGKALIEKLSALDIIGKQKLLFGLKDSVKMKTAMTEVDDDELRFTIAARLFEIDRTAGYPALIEVMKKSDMPIFRSEALTLLEKQSGDSYGFDPMDSPMSDSNRGALKKWEQWIESQSVPAESF